jgi:hypothetical protein
VSVVLRVSRKQPGNTCTAQERDRLRVPGAVAEHDIALRVPSCTRRGSQHFRLESIAVSGCLPSPWIT